MIPGLDRFRDRYSGHFHGLESRYLLIGGSAPLSHVALADLSYARSKPSALAFDDGRVLIVGDAPSPEWFDPTTDAITLLGTFDAEVCAHTVTRLARES